jgi:two-component system, response regulator, stage 0 sporulation protein F
LPRCQKWRYLMSLARDPLTDAVAVRQPRCDALDSRMSAIVLVDDEPDVLTILHRVLRGLTEEHALTGLSTGQAALELIELFQVRLLITDYNMAGMDGLQLIQSVKNISPQTQTVLITAYDSPDLRRRARVGRADHYLAKPFALEQLEYIVRTALAMP